MIDLHTHSTASDGKFTPTEIAEWAASRKLTAVALTDHDTTAGLSEAEKRCAELGVKFVRGVEFSTYAKCEIHILGYNIDYLNPEFGRKLEFIQSKRIARNVELKEKLHSLNVPVEIDATATGVGRMNFARAMVAQGFCPTVNLAFEKYLGADGIAYTPASRLKPFEAVQIIQEFGGVAVLAHPKRYFQEKSIDLMIEGLMKYGLKGIEVFYPSHNETDVKNMKALAAKYHLVMTGGSDFHGDPLFRYPEFEPDDFLKRVLKI